MLIFDHVCQASEQSVRVRFQPKSLNTQAKVFRVLSTEQGQALRFSEKPSSARGPAVFSPKPCTVGTRHFAACVLRDFGLRAGILNLLNSSYYGKHVHHRNLAAMRCSVQQQIRTDTALPGFETVIRNICSAATTIRPSLLFYISINIHSIYLKSN